jgi:Pvc16 N-terminal domain
MANHLAIHSVCQSLSDYLSQSYATFVPDPGMAPLPPAKFDVLSSSTFSSTGAIPDDTVTLFLHRISINNALRNTRVGPAVGALGLDLHLLLTVWAADAGNEHILLGWAMRQMHYHAYLDRSSLTSDAAWDVDQQITVMPTDINGEEMARIWEASNRGYRLSFPYIVRIVRLGMTLDADGPPVVATRLSFADNLAVQSP